jgi:hypothetical protein
MGPYGFAGRGIHAVNLPTAIGGINESLMHRGSGHDVTLERIGSKSGRSG